MIDFTYRALDADGRRVRGRLQATDLEDLEQRLRDQNLELLHGKPATSSHWLRRQRPVSRRELIKTVLPPGAIPARRRTYHRKPGRPAGRRPPPALQAGHRRHGTGYRRRRHPIRILCPPSSDLQSGVLQPDPGRGTVRPLAGHPPHPRRRTQARRRTGLPFAPPGDLPRHRHGHHSGCAQRRTALRRARTLPPLPEHRPTTSLADPPAHLSVGPAVRLRLATGLQRTR